MSGAIAAIVGVVPESIESVDPDQVSYTEASSFSIGKDDRSQPFVSNIIIIIPSYTVILTSSRLSVILVDLVFYTMRYT